MYTSLILQENNFILLSSPMHVWIIETSDKKKKREKKKKEKSCEIKNQCFNRLRI